MELVERKKRDFKGVWIPIEDVKKYGWRDAYYINAFKCNAPMNLSPYQLRKIKRKIFQKINNPVEIKNFLLENKGNEECEWCKNKTFILHKHHYPIKKIDGGIEIVNICPNCHSSFHYIDIMGVINGKK